MSAKMSRIAPVFPVRSVASALEHYRALGFQAQAYSEVAADGPIYGFIDRDGIEIHLTRVPDLDPLANTSAAYLYVDDADALRQRWASAGVLGRLTEAESTPYGLREFAHVDPDGNLLRVGSEIEGPPSRAFSTATGEVAGN